MESVCNYEYHVCVVVKRRTIAASCMVEERKVFGFVQIVRDFVNDGSIQTKNSENFRYTVLNGYPTMEVRAENNTQYY